MIKPADLTPADLTALVVEFLDAESAYASTGGAFNTQLRGAARTIWRAKALRRLNDARDALIQATTWTLSGFDARANARKAVRP